MKRLALEGTYETHAQFARAGVIALSSAIGSDLTTLSVCNLRTGRRRVLSDPPNALSNADIAAFNRYFHSHPLVRYHAAHQDGGAHRITAFRTRFLRRRFAARRCMASTTNASASRTRSPFRSMLTTARWSASCSIERIAISMTASARTSTSSARRLRSPTAMSRCLPTLAERSRAIGNGSRPKVGPR